MISGRGKGEKGHTPLDCLEDAGLERLGEAGVQGAGLLTLAFYSLEIVQAAFAGDLALELPETIEGHACSKGPKKKRCLKGGEEDSRKGRTHRTRRSRRFPGGRRLDVQGLSGEHGRGPGRVL